MNFRKNSNHSLLAKSCSRAFTLVELLVSMVILMLIVVISVSVISQTQKVWLQGSARIEQFREARMAFESITQSLTQATLNTYNTYYYSNNTTVPSVATDAPTKYVRHSELQFITGVASSLLDGTSVNTAPGHCVFFQAPLGYSTRVLEAGSSLRKYKGLKSLLCGRGYFLAFGDDSGWKPDHVTAARNRYRLMEFRPPAEENKIYSVSPGLWFRDAFLNGVTTTETAITPAYTRPVAENIVALIISPQVAPEDIPQPGTPTTWIAPTYAYDSSTTGAAGATTTQGTQHMLPPIVEVTLVAIDEASARKLEEEFGSSPPSLLSPGAFSTTANLEANLKDLEETLIERKLAYRVFTTAVALKNAKWNLL